MAGRSPSHTLLAFSAIEKTGPCAKARNLALRDAAIDLVSVDQAVRIHTIGFIGLVGPHIARMLLGEDQRFFLPGSILCGALLLSVTSVVSKMLIPGAIMPIGVITALVGVPFFFSLIFTNRRRAW